MQEQSTNLGLHMVKLRYCILDVSWMAAGAVRPGGAELHKGAGL